MDSLLTRLPNEEPYFEQTSKVFGTLCESRAIYFFAIKSDSNIGHFVRLTIFKRCDATSTFSEKQKRLSFCGCRGIIAVVAAHLTAPHLRNRGMAGWLDGWADSVDTVRPPLLVRPVAPSSLLRLIVSQMNALMNPHYITRLVCEERREKRGGPGRRRHGRRVVYCTYRGGVEDDDEEETDRCVYRGIA